MNTRHDLSVLTMATRCRLKRILATLCILSPILLTTARSQAFIYYPSADSVSGLTVIHRFNLQSAADDTFSIVRGNVSEVHWDSEQRWLYVSFLRGFEIISTADTSVRYIPFGNQLMRVYGVAYVPQSTRFYLFWEQSTDDGATAKLLSKFDGTTLSDVVYPGDVFVSFDWQTSVSGTSIYCKGEAVDTPHVKYAIEFSTQTNSIVGSVPVSAIGPSTSLKAISEVKDGKVLMNYAELSGWENKKYLVYDLSTSSSSPPISFPWRSSGLTGPGSHLSSHTDYMIVERVNLDPNHRLGDFRPGEVYIFETATGKLTQRVTLPPQGKVYVFDNPSNTAYYYADSAQQSYAIDLSIISSVSVLIDSIINMKHRAQTSDSLGDQDFANELDSILVHSKSLLINGDSNNCYRQIKLFQQMVDSAYKDTLHLRPNRMINLEGWKSLHFNAGYILARFQAPPTQFNLALDVVGNGSIAKFPNLNLYDSATSIQLTSTANLGYSFTGWSGDATGSTNPLSVTMDGDKSITATFTQITDTITASGIV